MVLKRRLFLLCVLLLALPVGCARAVDRGPVPGYVRLHVVAASDSEEDQALKLEVRDAVLAAARTLLVDCQSAEDAWRAVNAHREDFARAAEARLRALFPGRAIRLAAAPVQPDDAAFYAGKRRVL